jgi:hypothetical protein
MPTASHTAVLGHVWRQHWGTGQMHYARWIFHSIRGHPGIAPVHCEIAILWGFWIGKNNKKINYKIFKNLDNLIKMDNLNKKIKYLHNLVHKLMLVSTLHFWIFHTLFCIFFPGNEEYWGRNIGGFIAKEKVLRKSEGDKQKKMFNT